MAGRKHILVVDDERDLADTVAYNLRKAGYDVTAVATGRAALDAIANKQPDLVLLDVMLPELSGTEVASRIRSNPATMQLPIVMLTAKGEEVDQLVGLTVGADDYIPKPFSMKILLARIEAVLRRTQRDPAEVRSANMNGVDLNLDTHECSVDGVQAKLTLTEFRLLASLIQAGGRVLSRSALMSRAMGPGVMVTERTIDVHITSIRKKLGDKKAGMIKTVRGVGYRATTDLSEGDEEPEAAGADSREA
ncbi:DNA-binding response regulator [Phycisphaerae bacterium]|jgi:two-component system phosphate regulon response regulator PhoB|nr:DNA-binding response regulator [Phycisphaerae bacterium]